MGPSMELQRWAGRLCVGLVIVLAMTGYYFANIRFAPVAAGFAILAGVFYVTGRPVAASTRPLRDSGAAPRALSRCPSPGTRSARRSSGPETSTGRH